MTSSSVIILAITIATFVITIGTLIWRMAILHHQVVINTEALKRAHERVDELKSLYEVRIDSLSTQITAVREAQIRMDEKINMLINFEKKRQGMNLE